MDKLTFTTKINAGELLVAGVYRHSKAEMLNWRDKVSGRAMSAPVLRHTLEFGSETVSVSERVPENTRLEEIKIPWVKGQRVVLHLEELTRNMGLLSARGSLEPLQDGPGDGQPVASGQQVSKKS